MRSECKPWFEDKAVGNIIGSFFFKLENSIGLTPTPTLIINPAPTLPLSLSLSLKPVGLFFSSTVSGQGEVIPAPLSSRSGLLAACSFPRGRIEHG